MAAGMQIKKKFVNFRQRMEICWQLPDNGNDCWHGIVAFHYSRWNQTGKPSFFNWLKYLGVVSGHFGMQKLPWMELISRSTLFHIRGRNFRKSADRIEIRVLSGCNPNQSGQIRLIQIRV